MATGEGENGNHSQLGYGSCDWGTGRVIVCPPGPEATRRLSLAGAVEGQDETSQSGHRGACGGDEDVTLSPSVALQRVYGEDDMEVVIRSPWQRHARVGEQERVTQLAAHSISDGKWSGELHHRDFTEQSGDFCEGDAGAVAQSLPQSWRAGDAIGSVRTPAGLPTSMAEFTNRRTVTAINVSMTLTSNIVCE